VRRRSEACGTFRARPLDAHRQAELVPRHTRFRHAPSICPASTTSLRCAEGRTKRRLLCLGEREPVSPLIPCPLRTTGARLARAGHGFRKAVRKRVSRGRHVGQSQVVRSGRELGPVETPADQREQRRFGSRCVPAAAQLRPTGQRAAQLRAVAADRPFRRGAAVSTCAPAARPERASRD
jgi:hypothetical protein